MRIDYHMHLELDEHVTECRYDLDRLALYLESAARNGVDEIGITEHCHRFAAFRRMMWSLTEGPGNYEDVSAWMRRFFYEDLDAYVGFLVDAKRKGLPVKVSIEVDYIPKQEETTRAILDRYPWDYVLGSVHWLGRWGIDYSPESGWPDRTVDEAYRQYFRTLQSAARSGLFQVLAHPDLIKKFGHRPTGDIAPLLDETVDVIAQAGVAIEISTAGLRKPVSELYPSDAFLERCYRHGVPITLASDAHDPSEVGYEFDAAVRTATECGYREITCFLDRQPYQVPLT